MPTNDVKSRNRILIIVAWIIAAAVLVTALVYFNFIEKDADKSHVLAVGDKVPDFAVSTATEEIMFFHRRPKTLR